MLGVSVLTAAVNLDPELGSAYKLKEAFRAVMAIGKVLQDDEPRDQWASARFRLALPVTNWRRRAVPPVLTNIDKELGASILRAGVRVWASGAVKPVAAIKVVRHNLYRPTPLFHETGHQVAHLTGWTEELAGALGNVLSDDPALRSTWTSWSSEIFADVFAFAPSVCWNSEHAGENEDLGEPELGADQLVATAGAKIRFTTC